MFTVICFLFASNAMTKVEVQLTPVQAIELASLTGVHPGESIADDEEFEYVACANYARN